MTRYRLLLVQVYYRLLKKTLQLSPTTYLEPLTLPIVFQTTPTPKRLLRPLLSLTYTPLSKNLYILLQHLVTPHMEIHTQTLTPIFLTLTPQGH